MLFLKFINWLNRKWNNAVFWIHDVTTRIGIGHTSVWLFDNTTWTLPYKWQLIAGKTHEQYMLEHELYIARHQVTYYSNLAYVYMWENYDLHKAALEDSEVVYEGTVKEEVRDDVDKVGK